ncbi:MULTISPECIES: DUF1206 domain-containing protein [unclassified Leptolyngbya]|uniref:DUF1206 domain-containing protein n=1 Tax=unclassified Leptolyngbya TaxID=2650499 RepID=UPI00168A1661|nr:MULTISPECIES: DUF1206 domain-containing protein [unclassified Leptolyngbya]MBD1913049.1 DUF1206 domain-containing protein [Leptolyngbya sp. FACHB-8]MBD2154450.1 DUF1206 domain-containing protein [Leptolyngbya sp. FACHB-16]
MKLNHVPESALQQEPAKWIERFARFGYAAKGIVYILVGILAFQAAFHWGGKVTNSQGALQTVATQPFGRILLFLVALGLIGYVVWQVVQTIWDPEHNDRGAGAIARRFSYVISGLIYASLTWFALRVSLGNPASSGGGSSQQAATLLSKPFGQWLLGLIGVAIISYGFYCFYRAFTRQFQRRLKLDQMSQTTQKWVTRISRFGLFAKGIVALVIGYFVILAARAADPNQIRDTEGALQAIQQQPLGAYLMGITALGLIAYGVFMETQARYRKISP